MTALFRPEAIDGQRQSWLGGVLLIRPLSLTMLTLGTVSAAALLVGHLFLGEYTRYARIAGVLAVDRGSAIPLPSPRAGQAVRRGDLLFVLVPESTQLECGPAAQRRPGCEHTARPDVEIRAPEDGMLTARAYDTRTQVAASDHVALSSPSPVALQVELHATAGVARLLQPGQQVRLRYPAMAAQAQGPAGGRVLEVSRTPLSAAEVAMLAPVIATENSLGLRAAEPLYRVTVALDPPAVAGQGATPVLGAGMLVEADVRVERRRLIDWLFLPDTPRSAPA